MGKEKPKYMDLTFIFPPNLRGSRVYVHDVVAEKIRSHQDFLGSDSGIGKTLSHFAQKEHGGYRVVAAFPVNKSDGEGPDEVIVIMERE